MIRMSEKDEVINYKREIKSNIWIGGHRCGYYRNRGRSYQHKNRKEDETRRF